MMALLQDVNLLACKHKTELENWEKRGSGHMATPRTLFGKEMFLFGNIIDQCLT